MSKVYDGDEWKRVEAPEDRPTRAYEQRRINAEYCNGRMDRAEWRRRSDELSDPEKWTAGGRIL